MGSSLTPGTNLSCLSSVDYSLLFCLCQECARVDPSHDGRDPFLAGWRPLRVVLPHDPWADTKNVCNVLLCPPANENLCC